MPSAEDLTPTPFPDLSWTSADRLSSLKRVYDFIDQEASRASNWYFCKRRAKRRLGYGLRIGAIAATTLAGLIPVLASIYTDGIFNIQPAWSTVALASAALLIALDRFGGYTSGWIRYVKAGQEIKSLLEAFRFRWERWKVELDGHEPTVKEAQTMLREAQSTLAHLHSVIQTETNKWATDFQMALRDMESTKKTPASNFGGLAVNLINSNQVGTWQIAIDGGDPQQHTGQTALISDVAPGVRDVLITSNTDGKSLTAKKSIIVSQGMVTSVDFHLS